MTQLVHVLYEGRPALMSVGLAPIAVPAGETCVIPANRYAKTPFVVDLDGVLDIEGVIDFEVDS